MNDPSSIAHEIQAAAIQFRASHRTLRSYLPWASDATLLRLASEVPDDTSHGPSNEPPNNPLDDDSTNSPTCASASHATAPASPKVASSNAPKVNGPLVFADVTEAIRWAFSKRAEVLDEPSVPSTSQDLYDYLRGATIDGKPINPVSFGRCVASSKILVRTGKVKDPHHSVRQLTAYELMDTAQVAKSAEPSQESTKPAPIVTARIKPSASAAATLTPESLLIQPAPKPVADPVDEEVRARLGLPLARIGTDFLSAGDLFAECFKIKEPIHLADVEMLMNRRQWTLNGRRLSVESLRRHSVPLMDKRVFHVGEDASSRGRPRILYGSKPMPNVTPENDTEDAVPISESMRAVMPASPVSAPSSIASTSSLTSIVHAMLRELGPLTTTEILSTLKRMTTVPANVQQVERAQVVGVIMKGRGVTFENKGAQHGQTVWGAIVSGARNALVKLPVTNIEQPLVNAAE